MALDPLLLEILACPEDKGPLLYFEDEATLYNPRLRRRYRILDGIPVLLVEEAETVTEEEHERLEAKATAEGVKPNFDPAWRGPSAAVRLAEPAVRPALRDRRLGGSLGRKRPTAPPTRRRGAGLDRTAEAR